MSAGLLGAAVVSGLFGSAHCVGMCGGFATSTTDIRFGSLVWTGGRLSTYAILGALGGATGAAIPGPPWVSALLSTALLVWFSGRLAGVIPELGPHMPAPLQLARRAFAKKNHAARFVFGMATGLLPCGLVYAAMSLAVAAASPVDGALTMVAFGLGTAPALLLLTEGVRSVVNRTLWGRRVVAAGVLAVGLWSVNLRSADGFIREDGTPSCHEDMSPK